MLYSVDNDGSVKFMDQMITKYINNEVKDETDVAR